MIVPMKKVTVVVEIHNKSDMLSNLRKSGIIHIFTENVRTQKGDTLQKDCESFYLMKAAIEESIVKGKELPMQKDASAREFQKLHESLQSLYSEKKVLNESIVKDNLLIEQIKEWGDFNPSAIEELEGNGIKLSFYQVGKKELLNIPEAIKFIELDPVDKQVAIAVINSQLDPSFPARRFEIPELGLVALKDRVEQNRVEVEKINTQFEKAQCYFDSYKEALNKSELDMHFEKIYSQMNTDDSLSYVTGYIPVTKFDKFEKTAKNNCWGYLADDPDEEDLPPTLVQYKRGVGIIKPLFDILGTVPGYREGDISEWFLMFFTLFFAMIIGDAGYGFIFLIAGIIMQKKTKELTTANILIYVLSIATIIWGSITGTWFGSATIISSTPLKYLVIPAIANYPALFNMDSGAAQNNIMQFCFILGTIQLSLAEVINITRKARAKDISLIADIGWLMDILSLYFVVLNLVIQKPCNYGIVFPIIGVGFLLVVVFGSQKSGVPFGKGLAAGGGGFFTTFLNTISCFSNIMSYIRLFAVGLATLAIAQSFNAMAAPMFGGITTIIGILILIIGHVLNLAMGLLSVIVHGVRLNLLEFSGQLNMEWSGIEYEPFSEAVKE
ncbi:MAG: ATPase [Spirochaetaceae bacterium]|nr:ATPase [Spirochaetaceae bacterium]